MVLLSPLAFSLFTRPSERSRTPDDYQDPERGDNGEQRGSDENGDDRFDDDENDVDDDDDVPRDREEEDNKIIHEIDLDQPDDNGDEDDEESPPATRARRGTIFGQFPTISSFVSTTSNTSQTLRPSTWWPRFKNFVNPKDDVDIDDYIPHYRTTPIISGVIIPFSILLEIPGLTSHWYIRTQNNMTIQTQKNPPILDVGMAISLASAIAANIFLVLRFLEVRVKTMTLACIFFLSTHGGFLLYCLIWRPVNAIVRRHQCHCHHYIWRSTSFQRWIHVWTTFLAYDLLNDCLGVY
jgi:potassium channel subfamily K, other eukaryote